MCFIAVGHLPQKLCGETPIRDPPGVLSEIAKEWLWIEPKPRYVLLEALALSGAGEPTGERPGWCARLRPV